MLGSNSCYNYCAVPARPTSSCRIINVLASYKLIIFSLLILQRQYIDTFEDIVLKHTYMIVREIQTRVQPMKDKKKQSKMAV